MTTEWPVRCHAEIDLGALEYNIRALRGVLPSGCRYISVVKADAYGHGLSRVASFLAERDLVDLYAVAGLSEAAVVRGCDARAPILILSAVFPGEEDLLVTHNLTPTVSSAGEVERFDRAAARAGRKLPVHLKVDTGMGRLGIWHEWADPLFRKLAEARHLELRGVYTHLSSADSDPEFTAIQRRRFLDVLGDRPEWNREGLLVHADNSAGLDTFAPEAGFNAVRIGLAQYGVPPFESASGRLREVGLRPVCSLHSRVSLLKELPAGTEVSYGRTCRLERPTRVAVVGAGYGDGIPLACGNRASVLVRERRCPILGRVTMDEVMVDVSDLPEVACGDRATFFGRQGAAEITIREFSAWSRTIPWEVLCSLTNRVKRVYLTSSCKPPSDRRPVPE